MKNARFFLIVCLLLSFFTTSNVKSQDFFDSIKKKYTAYKNSAPKERIYIITDRDVYATGELIWVSVTIYDIHKPRTSKLSDEVIINLRNHESGRLLEKTFKVAAGNGNGFIGSSGLWRDKPCISGDLVPTNLFFSVFLF